MLPDSAAVQPYSVFRPTGYSSLARLDFGRGPSPYDVDWHLTQVRIDSDYCQGLNDVLTVTLPAPIVGDVSPEDFSVRVCRVSDNTHGPEHQDVQQVQAHEVALEDCEVIVPSCARLQLEEEPRERRTVLLFGQFAQIDNDTVIYAPSIDFLKSITFLVDGNRTEVYDEFESGTSIGWCATSAGTAIQVFKNEHSYYGIVVWAIGDAWWRRPPEALATPYHFICFRVHAQSQTEHGWFASTHTLMI